MAFIHKEIFWKGFKIVFGTLLVGVLFVFLFFISINLGLFGSLPSLEEIQNPQNKQATEVFSEDYVLLGTYYFENRTELQYKDLPASLVNALIATEDKRFKNHAGIDLEALMRVLIKTGLLGQDAGGGSTITQQVAKKLFHQADYSSKWARVRQKFKEWVLAVKLERNFTKEELIALYFNTVDFLYDAYGIKAAAKTYFNKAPIELNVQESAALVGMLKGPGKYNPRFNKENCTQRRNVVMKLMADQGYLSTSDYDSLKQSPIILDFKSFSHNEGLAPYFRAELKKFLKDWSSKNKKPDGSKYNIYTDGLKIFTTVNSKMQILAESAVKEHMKLLQSQFDGQWKNQNPWEYGDKSDPQLLKKEIERSKKYRSLKKADLLPSAIEREMNVKRPMRIFTWDGEKDVEFSSIDSIRYYLQFLQLGFMAMSPKDGAIKAWVGGSNFKYFQLDHVNKGTKRQVGSTFKPFQYAVAIENNYPPCYKVAYQEYDEKWNPRGTDKWSYGELVPYYKGLTYSDNKITAQLMKEFGPGALVDMATKKLMIESNIEKVPSICLGVSDVSLIEMMGAYTVFANLGDYVAPYFISAIYDKNGNLLEQFNPIILPDRIKEETAYAVNQMMQSVVQEGTARRLRWRYNFTHEIAGKTGTTQSNSDGWFIGLTPDLMAGAWVGCEKPSVSFKTTNYGQGANTGLPIWALFMQKVYADKSLGISKDATFEKPQDGYEINFDCSVYDKPKSNPFD